MTSIWKRSISMFLALVMVFGMLPVNALAAETDVQIPEETSVTEPAAPETTEAPVVTEAAAPVMVEETTVPTQAVETTPVTEPVEETSAATEATVVAEETTEATVETEPVTEPVETEPETEPAETEPATEPVETEPEETVPEETVVQVTKEVHTFVPGEALPDSDELLAGYMERQIYGDEIAMFGTAAGARLTGNEKLVYDALVPIIKQIASGQRASATIALGATMTFYPGDGTIKNCVPDVAITFPEPKFSGESLDSVMFALLADMPYDLYWFDKVTGVSDSIYTAGSNMYIEFHFDVAIDYNNGVAEYVEVEDQNGNIVEMPYYYTADTAKTGAASAAASAAKAIVDKHADPMLTDYEKLKAYADEICALVSYDYNAAYQNNFQDHIDPWQVIYVFDGNTSTNVVCEGYAKAFQYLCDLTEFEGDVLCYNVTGTMDGGAHMWNIVTIGGQNYLVDVTNSDGGTTCNGNLFLVGTTATSLGHYILSGLTFVYDDQTQLAWEDTDVLTLATSNYAPPAMSQAELEAALEAAYAAGTGYNLTESITLSRDLDVTLSDDPYSAYFRIQNGAELIVPSGVTLTLNNLTYLVGGKLTVQSGGKLVFNKNYMLMSLANGSTLTVEDGTNVVFAEGVTIHVQQDGASKAVGNVPVSVLVAEASATTVAGMENILALEGYGAFNIIVPGEVTLEKDFDLPSNADMNVMGKIIIPNGVTMTVRGNLYVMNPNTYLQINQGGKLFNAAGYIGVHEGAVINNGTIEGFIDGYVSGLTQDQFLTDLNAAIANGNKEFTITQDLTLTSDVSIDLPEGFVLYVNGAELNIPEGMTLTVNGGKNGSGITLNQGHLNVDGTLNMNTALFLNDNSGAVVNGTLNSNVALHVGFWKPDNADCIAGALLVNGTLNNRGYLNIAPEDINCGGSVTVNGTLNSLRNEPDAEGNAMHGFVQLDGIMTVNSGAVLGVQADVGNGGILVGGEAALTVATGADLSGVQPGMIVTYPWSNANVTGIPQNLLTAAYEVYSTEELVSAINAINAGSYANAEVHPMGGFLLEEQVTIPENTALILNNPDHENYYWSGMGVGNNTILTNNGTIIINDWARLAIEGGSALVNNGYIGVSPNGWLMHMGTFTDNGTVESEGQVNDGTMSQDDLEGHLTNANGWVHEMTTRLEQDMIIDLPNGFFLDTYGRLIVPSGVTLTLNGNLEFVGWGEINVEDGGKLIINGTLTIPEDRGWVNIYPGAECQINGTVNGEINYIAGEDTGDTDPYISSYWVHNYGEGYFMNDEQYGENRQAQMTPGVNFNWIFLLNVWDEDADQWVKTPLGPDQLGTEGYVNLVPLSEYEDTEFKDGEPNTDCFLDVVIPNETAAWDTVAYITYNHNGTTLKMPIYLERDGAAGFYSGPVATNATWMQFGMQINPFGGNTFYLIITDEVMTAQNVRLTNHADKVTMTKVSDTVYRIDVKDEAAANIWQTGGFNVAVNVDMYQNGVYQYTWDRDLWCNTPDLGRYDAWFMINGDTYTYHAEGDGFLVDTPDGPQVATLPSGVYYDYENNILTLQDASLEQLALSYHWQERDEQGNVIPGGDEHYDLPSQNLTLNLIGTNTISCDYDAALSMDNDIHVTIGGSGSLYLFSDNGTGHTNEWGNYAYNTVQVNGRLTIAGNTTVTAEIAGTGKHGDNDAWLHAVCGHNGAYLTVTDNATLNAKLPEGARRYDNTDDYWGGYAGVENFINITVEEDGKLNTDTLNVSDGRSFTQTGGTVTLNPVGGIWVDDEGVEHVDYEGFWMSGGRLDLSGGTMTINVNAQVSSGENGSFTGIGTENSVVNISGGTLNINSNSQGCSLNIGCQFNEQGPIAGTGSTLNVSGGTINIYTAGAMNAAMDVYPISTANFTGGTINVDMAHLYFGAVKDNEPAIIWDGTNLNGDCVGIYLDGSFEMRSGTIHLDNLGFIESNGMVAINGGTIDLDNSVMYVNMSTGFAGDAYLDIDIDDTILAEPINCALQNNMYLSLNGNAKIDIDIEGLAGTNRVIHGILNNGTFHQMDDAVVTVNAETDAPVMLSNGQLLLNDGTLTLNGGNIALVQSHDFERPEDAPSMTQVIDGTLNANGGMTGILSNGLVVLQGGNGIINASAQGVADNSTGIWPTAIRVAKFTGNDDGSGENVSKLVIDGGTMNLSSVDTSNNEACSKGLFVWHAPVEIGELGCNINIDAEMAVYSASDSVDETNFSGDFSFYDVDAKTNRSLTAIPMDDGYVHTVMNGDEYVGKLRIVSGVDVGEMTQEELEGYLAELEGSEYSGWVQESKVVLTHDMDIAMGDKSLYLAEGGILVVPNGVTLTVYSPTYVTEGQIIVQKGGTLKVDGLLGIQQGTVYIAEGGHLDTEGENCHIRGEVTFYNQTATHISSFWLDNWGEGWFENRDGDNSSHLNMHTMTVGNWIFYKNVWDAANLRWIKTPVVPTENSDYISFTKLADLEGEQIKDGEVNADYFLHVETFGTLDYLDTEVIWVDGVSYTFYIQPREIAFYTAPYVSMDTVVRDNSIILDPTAEENAFYLVVRQPEVYGVRNLTWDVETWGEDYNALVPAGQQFLTMTDEGNGVYKFTVHPDFVEYVQFDYKNFNLYYECELYHLDSGETSHHWGGDVWVDPPELRRPDAVLQINDKAYMIYEGSDKIFADQFSGEYDEWGNEIWERVLTTLPAGVSYDVTSNTMTLTNANLQSLLLGYHYSWTDDQGNVVDEYYLPNENFTLNLVGYNTISSTKDTALHLDDEVNVTITGTGSLNLKSTNSIYNVNQEGNRYAYNTVQLSNYSTLTIAGSAKVTAAIDGQGYHGDYAAWLQAICGDYERETSLTVKDSATLTVSLPLNARRYDDTDSYDGGYAGIENMANITVADNATLNAESLFIYEGKTFTQTGGTVNIDAPGGVYYDYQGNVAYHYDGISANGGTINISGGVTNINAAPNYYESASSTSFYGLQGVNNATVNISGGEINITGGNDGLAVIIDCLWDENGYVAGTGSVLNMTGGSINTKSNTKTPYGGIFVFEECTANFTGGSIYTNAAINRFFGDVVWGIEPTNENQTVSDAGTVFVGDASGFYTYGPGSFHMCGGEITLNGVTGTNLNDEGESAVFETNGPGAIHNGKITINNGILRNNMNFGVDGGEIHIVNTWKDLAGLIVNNYMPINAGVMNITTNAAPSIVVNGTYHQMGGEVTANETSNSLVTMQSLGSTLLNDGVLNLKGRNTLVQGYLLENAAEGHESLMQASGGELNLDSSHIGIIVNGPVHFTGDAVVNVTAKAQATNDAGSWPRAIHVEYFTGNEDGSGENVSSVLIEGNAQVNLTSIDTGSSDMSSKGISVVNAPVTIRSSTDDQGNMLVPSVTIDAEMAIYSMSGALEDTNFYGDVGFRSVTSGQFLSFTSREFTETTDSGDYFHTLMEDEAYVGSVVTAMKTYGSLDDFLTGMANTPAGERYRLTESLIVDRDVTLASIVDVMSGAELIVKDGAVLTIPAEFHLVAMNGGSITVEAGGRVDNAGILANDGGVIRVFDGEDYPGYVHHSETAVMNTHFRETKVFLTTGIPMEYVNLNGSIRNEDQLNAILPYAKQGYANVNINVDEDLILNTITIPENVHLNFHNKNLTINSGAFVYNNGGMHFNTADVTINGKLIQNGEFGLNKTDVFVEGTFENNAPTFINDGSILNVSGTMNSIAPVHVGFWKEENAAYDAGTLNISVYGTMNNYEYLNICPDWASGGGVVNVYGTLNNKADAAEHYGFIEHHGVLNVYGTLNNEQSVRVYGGMYISGTLNNNGSVRLEHENAENGNNNATELIANSGARINNNTSIANASHGLIDMTGASYVHGSYTLPDGTRESAEFVQHYFEDGSLAPVEGMNPAQLCLMYEGADYQVAKDMVAYANANGYGQYIVRINGEMIIPEGEELVISKNSYLVVLYGGNLVLDGTVFNQGTMRLFGADMTIGMNGWLSNEGLFEAYDTVFGNYHRPQITVSGTMENYITGTMDLAAADCITVENGMIGNDLVNGTIGTIKGLDISQQTLWTGISKGDGQQQLKSLIQRVNTEGYGNAMVWLAVDTTITEQVIIPEKVTIIMQDGAKPTTLTIAPYDNATGKGGMLISEGYLNITQSSKIVNNGVFAVSKNLLNLMEGATFENNGQLSNMGLARIRTGSKLINNGLIQHGSTMGNAVMNVEGEYIHGENAEIVNSFVITDNGMAQANRINGIDIHLQKLNHVIAEDLPKHNETSLLQYFNAVSHGGYIGGNVYILRDMEKRSNWYVEPANWEDEKYSNFDVDVYVEGCTLTIPEVYQTLGANTSFYVRNGGKIDIQGAMFLHTDMLIQDGGTLNVDGTMNAGTVYVYEGGTLTANGNWRGYDPINIGGSISGTAFGLTQAELEQAMKQAKDENMPFSLNTKAILAEDLTIDVATTIGSEGSLVVPSGVTLTISAETAIEGQLTVQEGGKLIVRALLVNYTGTINVQGEYEIGTDSSGQKALVDVRFLDGKVTGRTFGIADADMGMHVIVNSDESFVTGMDFVGGATTYGAYFVQIQKDLELPGDVIVPENVRIHLEHFITVTVPENATLAINGEFYVWEDSTLHNKGIIETNGNLYIYGELINENVVDLNANSYLCHDGYVNNSGNINVNVGGCLERNGQWEGNEPVDNGGILTGMHYVISQDQLEAMIAEAKQKGEGPAVLRTQITLERNLTLDWPLTIEGGMLIVPGGVTLTNNAGLYVNIGGKLEVQKGATFYQMGRLVNNSFLCNNDCYGDGYVSIQGTYTHGAKAMVQVNATASRTAVMEGIDKRYQTLMYAEADEATLRHALALAGEGYGFVEVYASNTTLTEDVIIPRNVTVITNPAWNGTQYVVGTVTVDENVNVTVNGQLVVNVINGIPSTLENNGSITVAGGGAMYIYGNLVGKAPVKNGGNIYMNPVGSVDIEDVPSTNFDISKPENKSVDVQVTVKAAMEGQNAVQAVTWSSSNPQVVNPANIVENGNGSYTIPFAGGVGKVKLTATSIDGSRKTDVLELNVYYVDSASRLTAKIVGEGYNAATGLQGGQQAQILIYGSDPEKALDPEYLEYKVSGFGNPVVIDENGVVTGCNQNTTVFITAGIKNDPQRRTVMLNLKTVPLQPSDITLTAEGYAVEDGTIVLDKYNLKDAAARTINIVPQISYDQTCVENLEKLGIVPTANITWSSSSFMMASVQGQKDGNAVMTIRDGVSGTFTITGKVNNKTANLNVVIKDYEPKLASTRLSMNTKMTTGAATNIIAVAGCEVMKEVSLQESAGYFSKEYTDCERLTASVENGVLTIRVAEGITEIPNGTINLRVNMSCEIENVAEPRIYSKDITIQVMNTEPFVTILQKGGILNLFDTKAGTELTVSAQGGAKVTAVEVAETKKPLEYNEANGTYTLDRATINAATGNRVNLNVYLEGYRNPIPRTHFISSYTMKPYLTMSSPNSTLNTVFSDNLTVGFQVKLGQAVLPLGDVEVKSLSPEIASVVKDIDTDTIKLTLNPETGMKGGRVKISVQKDGWKEPIEVYHQITVQTTAPMVSLRSPMLTLNRIFTNQTGVTAVSVSHQNVQLTGIDFVYGSTFNSSEADKIDPQYDKKTNMIMVGIKDANENGIKDPEEAPKAGMYIFTGKPYVVKANGDKLYLSNVTVMVNVTATAPMVMLSGGSVRLNSYLAGGENAAANFQMFNGNGCKIIGYTVVNGSFIVNENQQYIHEGTVELGFTAGKLTARLVGEDKSAKNYTIKVQPIVYSETWEQEAVLDTQLTLNLQVYYSEQITVTAIGNGSLNTAKPENAVTYKVYWINNAACGVDDVKVVGEYDKLFTADMVDGDDKSFTLSMLDSNAVTPNKMYSVQLEYTVGGKTLAPVTVNVFVIKSAY